MTAADRAGPAKDRASIAADQLRAAGGQPVTAAAQPRTAGGQPVAAAAQAPATGVRATGTRPAGLRLTCLYLVSRRVPATLGAIAVFAIFLRVMLHWHWDAYGALQLPLMCESGAAAVIAVTTAGPFGDTERAAGRWLPFLRLGSALMLTLIAVGLLTAAGAGAHLAGGSLDVLRNVAGITGIGLLCAAVLGGALSWTGPVGYLLTGTYALYGSWHGMPSTTPWIWPARPPHDTGAALCAGLVLAAGLAVITVRGARDRDTEAG
jgi:hypothetical protein